ncbi:MAG: hypothetical protein LBK99_24875 [Opitutaceae bacterium]|nr:hypothetical protein [Opitutaceae bacterium]
MFREAPVTRNTVARAFSANPPPSRIDVARPTWPWTARSAAPLPLRLPPSPPPLHAMWRRGNAPGRLSIVDCQ